MDYTTQFNKMRELLHQTNNRNVMRDFFVQLQEHRSLDREIILNTLDDLPSPKPPWLAMVNKTDIRNIVVFLMWKEFQTVIDAKEKLFNEESSLGTDIEYLAVYIETMYYSYQIQHIDSDISYMEWVKERVDTKGLVHTIDSIMDIISGHLS
jgi:hypothetical protein